MKQATLAAAVGFERFAKTTRRVAFLAAMERVVPWSALCALIEPFYPKPGNVRPPIEIEADAAHLSRVAMVQYAEPGGGGGLYDSLAMRRFVDIISGASRCRDETVWLPSPARGA